MAQPSLAKQSIRTTGRSNIGSIIKHHHKSNTTLVTIIQKPPKPPDRATYNLEVHFLAKKRARDLRTPEPSAWSLTTKSSSVERVRIAGRGRVTRPHSA